MVGCRKGDGHGNGYGHGHAQRTFEQILQTLQLALPIANAVFQCGHMMANTNCLDERQRKLRAEGRKNGFTDLDHRGLMKDCIRRVKICERFEPEEEGLEGIRVNNESEVGPNPIRSRGTVTVTDRLSYFCS